MWIPCRGRRALLGLLAVAAGCSPSFEEATPPLVASTAVELGAAADDDARADDARADALEEGDGAAVGAAEPSSVITRPDWLGQRVLPTTPDGSVTPQTTPEELRDRRLPTIDTRPPPATAEFSAGRRPLSPEVLGRSTWREGCPVGPDELTFLTLSFWGFDGRPHTGEMIVNAAVAEDIVEVFRRLFEARFPIEEMRIVTDADLAAPATGDGNNTTGFVCRPVTGGTRFSEHASGLAVDVNPFHNPYRRGELVLPELAAAYLDRSPTRPGMMTDGDVVVEAFEAIGWSWGGRWTSPQDYQHFSLHNR